MQAVRDRQAHIAKPPTPAAPRRRLSELNQASNTGKFYRPSRDGQRLIAGHFDPKIAKQLKLLAAEEATESLVAARRVAIWDGFAWPL